MRLSIVDLATVPPGGTASDAFAHSVALAQTAERLGFHRYWVAEHHGVGSAVASACPEILVARIAAATMTIRVGSGTVLLNYTRPLRVAETFRSLHAMFPGRIDLGLGRAASPEVVDAALRPPSMDAGGYSDPSQAGAGMLDGLGAWMAHEEDLTEVLAWLGGSFSDDDPRAGVRLVPGVSGGPEPWLLGSSPTSAMLAGRLGLRYGFAAFFNPEMAAAALRIYRASFQPSSASGAIEEPWSMLAVNACCAESDRDAARLRASAELFYRQGEGIDRPPLRDAEAAVAELGGVPEPTPRWARHLSGGPTSIRAQLEQLASEVEADEVMVQDLIADPAERVHSYELLAGAFELASASSSRGVIPA
jgi:alkanesulfonate monooxygenase SsuD/methylene tetrahydromethanopterin reductase-like flavin-dependent oxidoreductase (luciferase family)